MTIIHFTNPGEIDPRLITTMGVNVKAADSSPIGYFGTGLKYALATSLRLGCEVTILSGLSRMEFTTQKVEIRGKEFEQILMSTNGDEWRELAFTTDLGRNWQAWMAFREFYCNALDEGGDCGLGGLCPQAGQTTILVRGEAMEEAYSKRTEWFLPEGTELFPSVHCEISRRATNYLYYKRVRVGALPTAARFSFNLKGQHMLTEDRTLSWTELQKPIALALGTECQDQALMVEILTAPKETFEALIDFDWSYQPSELFIATVAELNKTHSGTLNPSAWAKVRRYIPEQPLESIELSPVERKQLSRAMAFLAENGHAVGEPIVFVESLGSQWIAGLAKEGKIFIPRTTFGKGTKFLASTLLEEHIHISRGLGDMTREMQDWLFDKVLSLMEDKKGEPL